MEGITPGKPVSAATAFRIIELVPGLIAEVERLRGALEAAAEQLDRVHADAFRQAAGLALQRSDGTMFSCLQLNMCDTAAKAARAALEGGAP